MNRLFLRYFLSLKNIFITFIFIYFCVGIFFSFHTGLSHDEPFEQDMWNFNMGLIKDFFLNKEAFFDYQEKYY